MSIIIQDDKIIQIGVIGGSAAEEKLYEDAEEVGKEIARAGCILICGGLYGVMEACSKGAKEQGGITVGILPGFEKKDANEYVDIKIVTAMSHARNAIIARSADALIAIGGELGTLSEISLALKIDKPVIVLEGGGEIKDAVKNIKRENLYFAPTPKEAVALAMELAE